MMWKKSELHLRNPEHHLISIHAKCERDEVHCEQFSYIVHIRVDGLVRFMYRFCELQISPFVSMRRQGKQLEGVLGDLYKSWIHKAFSSHF